MIIVMIIIVIWNWRGFSFCFFRQIHQVSSHFFPFLNWETKSFKMSNYHVLLLQKPVTLKSQKPTWKSHDAATIPWENHFQAHWQSFPSTTVHFSGLKYASFRSESCCVWILLIIRSRRFHVKWQDCQRCLSWFCMETGSRNYQHLCVMVP